jgi:hypothetical protein
MQLGDTLEEFLVEATQDQKLRQVMMSLSEAIRTIAFKVRTPPLDPGIPYPPPISLPSTPFHESSSLSNIL